MQFAIKLETEVRFWHHPWLTNGPLSRPVDYSFWVISRIPEAARLSDLIGNQRCVLPTARNGFSGGHMAGD